MELIFCCKFNFMALVFPWQMEIVPDSQRTGLLQIAMPNSSFQLPYLQEEPRMWTCKYKVYNTCTTKDGWGSALGWTYGPGPRQTHSTSSRNMMGRKLQNMAQSRHSLMGMASCLKLILLKLAWFVEWCRAFSKKNALGRAGLGLFLSCQVGPQVGPTHNHLCNLLTMAVDKTSITLLFQVIATFMKEISNLCICKNIN